MLLDHHQTMLEESAIDPATAEARGYYSLEDTAHNRAHLKAERMLPDQIRLPALAIPIYKMGQLYCVTIRPDTPRIRHKAHKDEQVKYEWPYGVPITPDIPAYSLPYVVERNCTLFLTEGAKKLDAIISHFDFCGVISVNGVWGWQRKNIDGEHVMLDCFNDIPLRNRIVCLALDGDARTNLQVRGANNALRHALLRRGAIVGVLDLSKLPNQGKRLGIDDALHLGYGPVQLGDLITYTRLDEQDRRFWGWIRETDPYKE